MIAPSTFCIGMWMCGIKEVAVVKLQRLVHTVGLNLQRGAFARGAYLRKHKIFAEVGSCVRFQPRMVPLYPELIKLHNNIMIGAGVRFVTHDAVHTVLNRMNMGKFPEMVGCIEVMDNVFIGADSTIMPNVRIGKNVVIGAGSIVTKDCEENSIYAGVPARRLGSFDDFVAKRRNGGYATVARNQRITEEEIKNAWNDFCNSR